MAIERRIKRQLRIPGDLDRWAIDEAERQATSYNEIITKALRRLRREREAAEG